MLEQTLNYITGEQLASIIDFVPANQIVQLIPGFDLNHDILLTSPLPVPRPASNATKVIHHDTQSDQKQYTNKMTTSLSSLNTPVANITPANTSSTTDALQQPTFIDPVEKIQADKKPITAGASKKFVSTSLLTGEDEEWESHFSTGKWYNKENEPYYKLLALCLDDDDDDDDSEFENQLKNLGIDIKFGERRISTPEPVGEAHRQ